MNEDISRLCSLVCDLVDSCADYEVTMDVLVTPARPDAYHEAIRGISDCILRIAASGMSREEIESGLMDPGNSGDLNLHGIYNPMDLATVVLGRFPDREQDIVGIACRECARAVNPSDPGPLNDQLATAIRPVTLADLLAPEATRMQRTATIDLLNGGWLEDSPGKGIPGTVLMPGSGDAAVFSGRTWQAVFRYLGARGHLPDPQFPGLLYQALYDAGMIRERPDLPPLDHEGTGDADAPALFPAGREVFRSESSVTDIRVLLRTAFHVISPSDRARDISPGYLERLAGHVLAGYAFESEQSGGSMLSCILELLRNAVSRPAGRAKPGTDQIREMDRNLQDALHLLRSVTGDYAWHGRPVPGGAGRPVLLVPGRHLLLYDPADLVHRSREALVALSIEALYQSQFGLKPMPEELPPDNPDWYASLGSIAGTGRAVRKGNNLHPGSSRLLEKFLIDEYSSWNIVVLQKVVGVLPGPDQFLAAVLAEARTGRDTGIVDDTMVKHVLDITREARMKLSDPSLSDKACLAILTGEVWPACRPLFSVLKMPSGRAGQASSSGRSSSTLQIPGDTVTRAGDSVPAPRAPDAPASGRAIAGGEQGLLDDDPFSVKIESQGPDTVAPDGQEASPFGGGGRPPGNLPGRHGRFGGGIQQTANNLMEACDESQRLLESIESEESPAAGPDSGEALREIADRIGNLAESLPDQLREENRNHAGGRDSHLGIGSSEEWEGMLKLSEQVRQAARSYRKAAEDLMKDPVAPGGDPSRSGSRTGITREALEALREAGSGFQQLAGELAGNGEGDWQNRIRLPGDSARDGKHQKGRVAAAFVPDAAADPELWESLSYFDATYGDDDDEEADRSTRVMKHADEAESRYEKGELALTREAAQYLAILHQRTRSEWETIDEKAERIRQIALYESHSVGEDDYALYQRFYEPVAGMISVARKNIQQALQKNRASRDITELTSGDDIDEENLAAVRTTMRIFKDNGRDQEKMKWVLSLLVDASSSMHDETVAKKLEATIRTVILFGEAVSHIDGIRFEIAAFADTEYIPLKRYQDEWNVHQGCYLVRQIIRASGGTNDVGAIGSALDRMQRLRLASGENRMIFVISDGQSGVGGREQLKQVILGHQKTRIFAWGVGPDMEKIEETYSPYGTWVPDISDLPRSLGETLRRELGRPAMNKWQERSAGPLMAEDRCTT